MIPIFLPSSLIWLGFAGTTGLLSNVGEVTLPPVAAVVSPFFSSALVSSLNSPLFLTACFLLSSSSHPGLLCVVEDSSAAGLMISLLLSSLVGMAPGGLGGGCFLPAGPRSESWRMGRLPPDDDDEEEDWGRRSPLAADGANLEWWW